MHTIIEQAINAHGRGAQTRLAAALGVKPQTVNKWYLGQTTPEMERWTEIEHALGLDAGTLMAAAGIAPDGGGYVTVRQYDELAARVATLEQILRELGGARLGDDPAAGTSRAARSNDAAPRRARRASTS